VVAGQLARRIRPDEASVTLVTDHATRDERGRWHQLAEPRPNNSRRRQTSHRSSWSAVA
jgi:hypothetical protein